MPLKTLDQLDATGRRVLVRSDLNVLIGKACQRQVAEAVEQSDPAEQRCGVAAADDACQCAGAGLQGKELPGVAVLMSEDQAA